MSIKPATLLLTAVGLVLLGATGYYLKHEAPIGDAENASLTTGIRPPSPRLPQHKPLGKLAPKAPQPSAAAPNGSHTTVTTSGNCKKTVTTSTTKTSGGGTATISNTSVSCSGDGSTNNVNVQSNSSQSSSTGSGDTQSGTVSNTDNQNVLIN